MSADKYPRIFSRQMVTIVYIYLFSFNNRIYIQEIYLFKFTGVFLIHDYIYSHLRDVFIHIHDRNIHSAFSAHHLCASLGPSSHSTRSDRRVTKHKCYMG